MEEVYSVTHSSTLPTTVLQIKAAWGGWFASAPQKKDVRPIVSRRGTSRLDSVFKCQCLHCQQLQENNRTLKWRLCMALPILPPFPLLYCKQRPPEVANLRDLLKKWWQPIVSYRGTSQLDSVFKCQWLHCQQLHENDRMLKWRQFMALPIVH